MKVKERKKERKGRLFDYLLYNVVCVVIFRLGLNFNILIGICYLFFKE